MMSIDPHHPLLIDNISALLCSEIDLSAINIKLTDYDGIVYLITGYNADSICFTFMIPQLTSVGEAGGFESIEANYSGFPVYIETSDITLFIDRTQIPDPSQFEARRARANQISQQFSLFRTHFLSGPFIKALRSVKKGIPCESREIQIRPNEKLWITPGENRVNMIFQVNFADHTDGSLSKVFLQEFVDAKRQVPDAPVISFSQNAPESIRSFGCSPNPHTIGFLSVTLLKEQIKNEEEIGRWLSSFKQYVTYHLHCCKTYLHMRMRKKADGLLKVLQTAVPERLEEKTFRRVRASKTRREESKIVYNLK